MGIVGEPILPVWDLTEFGPDFCVVWLFQLVYIVEKRSQEYKDPLYRKNPKRSSMFEILSTNIKNIDILHQSEQALHDMFAFCLSYFQPVNHYGTGQEASKLFEPTVEFGEL